MMIKINEFAAAVYQNNKEHGWHDDPRSFGDLIALCHSELSEALEEYRKGNPMSNQTGMPILYYSGGGYVADQPTECCKKPEGVGPELADVIIRILDICGVYDIDMEQMLHIKHEYNKTRSYRHGGKLL